MLSLKNTSLATIQAVDRTARHLLNLGRSTATIRPYKKTTSLGVTKIVLDEELFSRFLIFCATLDEHGLTDTELLLFLKKFSTEVNVGISETEAQLVFEELSNQVLNKVEYKETEEKDITQEWRVNSEKNI